MENRVYFIKVQENESDAVIADKLAKTLQEHGLLSMIQPKDFVAVKTHFGEKHSKGYIRPIVMKAVGDEIRNTGGNPFLTETSTLYRGERTNAVDHIRHAHSHGFGYEATGMPIIISDGLFGDEEIAVPINGEYFKEVNIAAQIEKSQVLVNFSHFTGHIIAGFGACIKNLGMGCVSRKGKLIQHSTQKPSIKTSKCTGCGNCIKWCPSDAISLKNNIAVIKNRLCIGCGECLAVCHYDAVGYNWGESYDVLQKKIAEHALGVVQNKREKSLHINFLTRISKECDCMGSYEPISPDIGILISKDPVAIDQASLDLFEGHNNSPISEKAFNIPYRLQIQHGEKIGLGSASYQLVECE